MSEIKPIKKSSKEDLELGDDNIIRMKSDRIHLSGGVNYEVIQSVGCNTWVPTPHNLSSPHIGKPYIGQPLLDFLVDLYRIGGERFDKSPPKPFWFFYEGFNQGCTGLNGDYLELFNHRCQANSALVGVYVDFRDFIKTEVQEFDDAYEKTVLKRDCATEQMLSTVRSGAENLKYVPPSCSSIDLVVAE